MKKKMTLEDAIKEVKKVAEQFKNKNGNSVIRISNKDFNLWIVNKLLEQDGRITKVETKQKMFMWFIVVLIPIITLILSVVD